MSSAVESSSSSSSQYGASPYNFSCPTNRGLKLEALTPPRSATSSVGDPSYLLQHPSTPQEFISGNSYYLHSPVHTPYTMAGSPAASSCDIQGYENNLELGFPPRSSMYMKQEEDDLSMLGGPFLSGDYGMSERNGDGVFEAWDETLSQVERTLPSPTPSADGSSLQASKSSSSKAKLSGGGGGRAPRKRKAGEKADKPKLPKLIKPLSELTREYHDLPIRNMESWVNRSAETRWAEVEKRGGYVTRPMNSFMLYRSAFAERTKMWCLQNNHQVVSSVSGESWPLEPEEIRLKYNELARIERMNHQAAHPGYKFSPSKALNNRKRKGSKPDDDTASAISELDDLDLLGTGTGTSRGDSNTTSPAIKKPLRSRKRTQKAHEPSASGSASPQVYTGFSYEAEIGGALRSSFYHTNPGKTPPMNMGLHDLHGQYYQTTVRASSHTPIPNPMPSAVIEDVTIRKTQSPGTLAFMQQRGIKAEPQDGDNSKVDPLLLLECGGGVEGEEGALYGQQCLLPLPPSHFLQEHTSANGAYDAFGTEPLLGQIMEAAVFEGMPYGEQALLDGTIDISKLPGYAENMAPLLDNCEPWSVEENEMGEAAGELCYDEWLQ